MTDELSLDALGRDGPFWPRRFVQVQGRGAGDARLLQPPVPMSDGDLRDMAVETFIAVELLLLRRRRAGEPHSRVLLDPRLAACLQLASERFSGETLRPRVAWGISDEGGASRFLDTMSGWMELVRCDDAVVYVPVDPIPRPPRIAVAVPPRAAWTKP